MRQKYIRELIEQLKPYNPRKIILFGSAAKGEFVERSDLDVLIIKDTKDPFWERQKQVATLLQINCEVDAFVLTPEEVRKALRDVQPFIYDIVTTGKIIYEQT